MSVRRFSRSDLKRIDPGVFEQATVVGIVPVTEDVSWAVECAWEAARAAAASGRRVALIDLSLERPALDRGSASTVHEGIVDAFLYGVSLGRVAQAQEPKGLHYIGVGTRAADPTEVWANPRWGRLTQGFAKEGALLMAFLPVSGVPSITLDPQGVILLAREGFDPYEHHFPDLDRWLHGALPVWIVEEVTEPHREPAPLHDRIGARPAGSSEPERPAVESPLRTPPGSADEPAIAPPATPAKSGRRSSRPRTMPPPPPRRTSGGRSAVRGNRRFYAGAGVVLVLAIGTVVGWPEIRARVERLINTDPSAPQDSVVTTPPQGVSLLDTATTGPERPAIDTSDVVAASPEPLPTLDSLFYSVQVAAFTTFERAMDHAIDVGQDRLPPAVTPIRIGRDRLWYRVIVGAFRTPAEADSTLQGFWSRGIVERGQGTVVRTPQTFDLGLRPTLDAARVEAGGLRSRGLPAYVVSAPDGARVFVGAFQRPAQAAAAEQLLTTAGITASLVQRMGIRQ